MSNYYKIKNLPSDVRAKILNKNRNEEISRNSNTSNESVEKEKSPIETSYTYVEAKRIIKRVDNWALYQPYNTDSEEIKSRNVQEKFSALKTDLLGTIELVGESDIDYQLATKLRKHKVFEIEISNAYELQELTEELLEIIRSYKL